MSSVCLLYTSRGQLLFIIDQVPYRAALKTATANVEAARAATSTADLTYKSNKELYAQKVVSEFSLKTAENSDLTAKAQLAQAEAQEISARNNLSYTCLLYTSLTGPRSKPPPPMWKRHALLRAPPN